MRRGICRKSKDMKTELQLYNEGFTGDYVEGYFAGRNDGLEKLMGILKQMLVTHAPPGYYVCVHVSAVIEHVRKLINAPRER